MITGALFALAAGLMWGLVFVGPLLLADYPPALLSFGRYVAFGLIAAPLAWFDRARLAQLTRADWLEAAKLGLVGNIVYYLFLSAAIQHAGGPLPTMIIGTLPVVIALASNRRDAARDGRMPWSRLGPSLGLIAAGIGCVNQVELAHLRAEPGADLGRYALGGALAVGAVLCWTWYPIRNADWLRAHPDRPPRAWATAQGVATLPMAALGYGLFVAWQWWHLPAAGAGSASASTSLSALVLGPRPAVFLGLMFAIGLLASWLGTLCWNEASQRLPTTLVGQLIVFETLSALAYALLLRGEPLVPTTALGVLLLVAGVSWALRARPQPAAAAAGPT